MNKDIVIQKQELRKKLILLSKQIKFRDEKLRSLQENLKQFLDTQSGTWGAYRSLEFEPEIPQLRGRGGEVTLVYPVTKDRQLEFWRPDLKNGDGAFVRSQFGILEPIRGSGNVLVAKEELNGFIVPGLGFDKRGYRLGWGKGFYDQTLPGVTGLKMGVCFSDFLLEEVPVESHDVRMDMILTDEGILKL